MKRAMTRNVMLVGVLFAGSLAAQRTWTVDLWNRAGTDFTDLPAAVAAASPGDVLRVRYVNPTAMQFYTLPTIQRGITIVGEGSRPICMDVLQVLGIPAGETVLISNLRFGTVETTLLPHPPARGVVLQNNLGSVFFDAVEYGLSTAAGSTDGRGLLVDHCSLVTLAHCVLYQSGAYIHLVDSNVVASNSSFLPFRNTGGGWTVATPLWCERSRLWLVDSEVRGGDQFPPWVQEASAISTCNSYFWLAGSTVVMPGWPYFSGASFCAQVGTNPWPTVCNPWYSEIRMSPGVQVSGISQYLLTITGPQPAITWSTAQSQLSLQTYGHPSCPTILAATNDPTPQLNSPLGHLFLGLGSAVVLAATTTDTQGRHTLTVPIPPGLPPNMHMTVQGVQLTPSANLALTNVTVVSTW